MVHRNMKIDNTIYKYIIYLRKKRKNRRKKNSMEESEEEKRPDDGSHTETRGIASRYHGYHGRRSGKKGEGEGLDENIWNK